MTKEIKDIMFETFKLAIDDELSPRMDLHKEPELLGTMMFSNQSIDSLSDAKPDVNHPMSENPRVQQIAKKERFAFDKDGKHEDEAHKLDLVKLFADTVRDTADAAPLARAPFTVQAKKAPAACYYNADADFAAIYDTKFIDALHPAAQLRTTSAISAALAYINDEPFAVVMPIRAEPNAARAIRAFFTEAAEANTKTDEADKLRAELAQAQEEAAALRGDLYRAANEIDELHETKTEQPAEQKPEPKTAAEIIAARWAEVDGLTATIKGATTAAPVVWLAGDTKPHEKEIEAAGGKWSGKKNAYYFRIA